MGGEGRGGERRGEEGMGWEGRESNPPPPKGNPGYTALEYTAFGLRKCAY